LDRHQLIFDLNKTPPPPDPQTYDVCIAGGGVAGIVLATKLARRNRKVALLEGGGFEFSEESQAVYQGSILGRSYFDLDSARLRFLGGTSNHWAGWCRPLDAHDFEKRSYIPHSGWPVAKSEIDTYLVEACQLLKIQPQFADLDLQYSNHLLNRIDFHLSPPVRFRDEYWEELRDSERIDVFLNSNLVNVRLEEGAGRVSELQCANYADPETHHAFTGKTYVLALGGIENPRLLLNCHSQLPQGIGNERDLVGRFFMEHFHAHSGYYVASTKTWPFGEEEVFLSPSRILMDSERIANAGLRVAPISKERPHAGGVKNRIKRLICANDIINDFAQSIDRFKCPIDPLPFDDAGILRVASEQVPNRNSRVLLREETDRFGLRRAALDWQANDVDRRTIKVMMTAFGRYLALHEYGNIKLEDWLLDDDSPIPGVDEDGWLGAGWHHMGTTRMATSPEEGVVDSNCKVFGTGNLYIAGSSVFPTGGHANPTLTIVQFTLRLCDHLEGMLAA
jgi:choline dehydrogenase-like flavoprotein